MKNFFKALGFTLLMGVIYLGANFLAGIVFFAVLIIKNLDIVSEIFARPDALMELVGKYALHMTIAANIFTLLIIWLIFFARKDSFKAYVGFRKIKIKDLMLMVVFGIALNFIVGPILSFVMEMLPQTMSEQYTELMEIIFGSNPSIIILILATSVMAPLFEEITLRGIVLNDFKKALPTWMAIVIQAVFFGVLHWNIVQGSYAFLIGLVFGIIYNKYKTIWAPIVMHLAFNFTSVMLAFFVQEESFMVQIVMLVIGCITIIPAIYLLNKNYDQASYEVI